MGRDFIGNLEIRRLGRAVAEVGHWSLILLRRCAAAGRQVRSGPTPPMPSTFWFLLSPAKREGPLPLTSRIIPQDHL